MYMYILHVIDMCIHVTVCVISILVSCMVPVLQRKQEWTQGVGGRQEE